MSSHRTYTLPRTLRAVALALGIASLPHLAHGFKEGPFAVTHTDDTVVVTVAGEKEDPPTVYHKKLKDLGSWKIVAALPVGDKFTGDYYIEAMTSDGRHHRVWEGDFDDGPPKSAPAMSVTFPISNDADALAVACDGRTAVVVGANSPTPVSLVDLAAAREVATAPYPGKLARAVAIDDAGSTAIVVLDNAVNTTASEIRRVIISPAGALADAGESLAFGGDYVSKVRIAPGGRFGIAIVGVGTSRLVSFSLPGLAIRGSVTLAAGIGNELVFNHAGDRIYARSGRRAIIPDVIQGFAFDPATGTIGQAATLRIDNVAGFTGVVFLDPMALSSDGTELLVVEDTPTPRLSRYGVGNGGLVGFDESLPQVRGVATPRPCSSTELAVEYYHTGFDHYFVTTLPTEIALLDGGAIAGWTRTGDRFYVYGSGSSATAATCRFFSNAFGLRSSHFYTPVASECTTVKANSVWQFEGEVFNLKLPAADGSCQTQEVPLYRVYNAGQGGAPNHRYTTKLEVRTQMVGQGWIPEGNGIGVIGCVPVDAAVGASVRSPDLR